jgi:protein-tyrosine-phosphatase
VSATSFGLEARDGSEADAAAVQAARTRQIDLSGHRARRRVELGAGDLVLAVEPAHLERVDRLARLAGAQASLLGLWARPAQPHIEDPFALSPEYFQTCYGVIDDAVRRLAEGLRRSRDELAPRYPVLVVQAETLGAVAVIRSLGRAGYPVHACATTAPRAGSPRAWRREGGLPALRRAGFLRWLRGYLAANGIRAIVPSESFLLAVRPAFAELAQRLPCPPSEEIAYAGMSKQDLFDALVSQGAPHLPPSLVVDPIERLPSSLLLQALGPPLYVKADAVHARGRAPGVVLKAESAWEARRGAEAAGARYRSALVQGQCRARRGGVRADLAERRGDRELCRRLHEVPQPAGPPSTESFGAQGSWATRREAARGRRAGAWREEESRLDEGEGDFASWRCTPFWGSCTSRSRGRGLPALLWPPSRRPVSRCGAGGWGSGAGTRSRPRWSTSGRS